MTTALADKPSRFAELPARLTKGTDPNGPDVVAVITCETVDADNEVVLAGGADLSRFRKNPVIQLCHSYGKPGEYYPLPVGKALWVRQEGPALIAGIRFARTSAMGREVTGLFEESVLSAFSIGFVSLEASPPTKEEKRTHPEWADASLIHRRWKLLEVSAVGIPSNEDALGVYVAKGGKLPPYISIPKHFKIRGNRMDPTADEPLTDPADESVAAEPAEVVKRPSFFGSPWAGEEAEKSDAYRSLCYGLMKRYSKVMHSGKAGHLYANPDEMTAHVVRHKDDDDGDNMALGFHSGEQVKAMLATAPGCKGVTLGPDHPEEGEGYERLHPAPEGYQVRSVDGELTITKAMGESSGTDGGYVTESEHSPDDADLEATHNPAPATSGDPPNYEVKAGHFIKWDAHKGMHAGCGKCMSVHKSGRVPDTLNDADADDETPHARVKCYKAKAGDPHTFTKTESHVAVACKQCKRMPMVEAVDGEKGAEPDEVKSVVPFAAGPVSDEAWDAAAAKKRLAKWASSDGSGDKDTIDWTKYAKAFTVCEGAKDDFVSYKMPHHDIKAGKLVVVKSAVHAALSALGGARGGGMSLPDADRSGAESHLKKHEKEWGGGDTDKTVDPATFKPPAFRTRAQVEADLERKAMLSIGSDEFRQRVIEESIAITHGAV